MGPLAYRGRFWPDGVADTVRWSSSLKQLSTPAPLQVVRRYDPRGSRLRRCAHLDAEDALLAERIAAAADAWLRDPQYTQVYARLVAATLAWRRVGRPMLDGTQRMGGRAEPSPPMEADPAIVLPDRLGDALGDVMAELHLLHAAPDDSSPTPASRARDEDAPHPERSPGDDETGRA